MTDHSKQTTIPVRFYSDFFTEDWPNLPSGAQTALAGFLSLLQSDPDNPDLLREAQRDVRGGMAYQFAPGYAVYWKVARESVQCKTTIIDVLDVRKILDHS